MAALGWLLNLGFAGGPVAEAPAEETTQNPGGWPSYGYRRKKKPRIEEIEEEIEAQEVEIVDAQAKIKAEQKEIARIEAKARKTKADKKALAQFIDGIREDMAVIEEMRQVHAELMTLRELEIEADRKRRKRNQITIILMDL